jgi:hypothetical protein
LMITLAFTFSERTILVKHLYPIPYP